jgi:hypothetical protein
LVEDRSLAYRYTGQIHRVVVAYSGSAQITADLWVYEEATEEWYKTSTSPVILSPNTITFFDIAVPLNTAERIQEGYVKAWRGTSGRVSVRCSHVGKLRHLHDHHDPLPDSWMN